jgi:hypothetical protein
MYLAVLLTGVLTWCWPDYGVWGALISGSIVSMLLWLCWKTADIDRTVPGNPIYLVLLIPAAILTYHLAYTGLAIATAERRLMNGALNASMLFHLAILAITVMLSQSLLPKAIARASVVRICGAAMIGGGILAGFRGGAEPVRQAMALVGYGGVALWLEPVWRPSISIARQGFNLPAYHRTWQVISLVAAVLASCMLAWCSPIAAVLAGVGSGITLVLASVIFARRSRKLLITGALLTIGGVTGAMYAGPLPEAISFGGPLLGSGENAFGPIVSNGQTLHAVSARNSGLQILSGTIGTPGMILTVMGLVCCLVLFMVRSRRDHAGDQAKCVAWTVAAMLCAGAFLNCGGMFVPAVTLAIGLTWGLAAEVTGRASIPRPGITVLVGLVAMMLLMGVSRASGLIAWSASGLWDGPSIDKLLHAVFGMLLAMTLAWLMGSRKLTWGLAGIALACLAGGAGEVIQYAIPTGRGPEWTDWGAHAAGCLVAAAPYVLCIGARQCESTDAAACGSPPRDPYIG